MTQPQAYVNQPEAPTLRVTGSVWAFQQGGGLAASLALVTCTTRAALPLQWQDSNQTVNYSL